ncbi:WS/DGAT domain-containing protein [Clostridium sp. WILCCON 0269]|uniref:WS/DGAT domain-containing protein n=1 Tax=Candidatus Clostridium eludens TaxID=3381663 RepID=A0ABW8SN68_9CLOT
MINAKINKINGNVRFHTEIWDQMQFFFKEYNDHQLHGVIYFEDTLERDLIKKAVLLSMDIVPILGSRFVVNKFHAYWKKVHNLNDKDIISFVDCTSKDEEVQRFITKVINEFTGPQLSVRVIRASNKDTLCIIMNHMVCDGAAFKEYLYLLGEIYTRLENGTYSNMKYINGSRSSKQIYKHFKIADKLKIFLLPNEPTKNKNDICFPMSTNQDCCYPFILIHRLSPSRFELLKKYSKKHSVTINDIILAAYYRILYKILNLNRNDSLTIPCMVDLRRYLPNKKASGICNLSSMIMCNIGSDIGNNFEETVRKVSAEMNKKKRAFPGLNGLSTLNLLFKFLPFFTVKKIIKNNYVNPMIGITNIGIIDSSKLIFGKTLVEDAFVSGSIKYPPYFQLAFTSFNNTITFTVNLYGNVVDTDLIEEFFILLDNELQI